MPPPVSDNDAKDSGNGVGPDSGAQRLAAPSTSLAVEFALKEERARREQLEAQLEALRSSESYRIGHALVSMRPGLLFRKRSKRPQPGSGAQRHAAPPTSLAVEFALKEERARREQLEAQLEALRSSKPFRVGHALVAFVRGQRVVRRHSKRLQLFARIRGLGRRLQAPRGKVLIVALGPESNGIGRQIEALQDMLVLIEPILLADLGTVSDRRIPTLTTEHLIPFEQWRVHRPPLEWGRYVAARITEIVDEHSPGTVVVLGSNEQRLLANLSAVLAPLALPAMADSESNVL